MLLLLFITLFAQFQGIFCQTVDANGVSINDKILQMERMLLTPQQLLSVVTPCNVNAFANPDAGEQSSAEWTRIIFHDSITANFTAGTGSVILSFLFLVLIY
jgi:hypothetical protein